MLILLCAVQTATAAATIAAITVEVSNIPKVFISRLRIGFIPRGTQAHSESMCMSRGINLVGLNRWQSGDTGDSTPGACALGSVDHHGCRQKMSGGNCALKTWQTSGELRAERRCFWSVSDACPETARRGS